MSEDVEHEKRLAAQAAARLVEDGMAVGLGTGSTIAHFLPALAARGLDLRCVATSAATEEAALALGLVVVPFDGMDALARLDLAVDGADQIGSDGWVVKGGSGAHTREKVVAAAADRFVVIASSDKLVARIEPPVPLELHRFGLAATLEALGVARIREGAPESPDDGVIADWIGAVEEPSTLSAFLADIPGVVAHGLFDPALVSGVLVGRGGGAAWLGS